MESFQIEFYLASNPRLKKNNKFYSCSTKEINLFAKLYAENLILKLGEHYELYKQKESVNRKWNLNNVGDFTKIQMISTLNRKTRLTSVSGNVGESLIIPVLSKLLENSKFKYHRLVSAKKCPDFRIEHSNELLNLWGISAISMLQEDIPLEVKSKFGKDEGYLKEALEQLVSYWKEMHNSGFSDSVGFGIIARVNLFNDGGTVRFILFRPRDCTSRQRIIDILNEDTKVVVGNIIGQESEFFI